MVLSECVGSCKLQRLNPRHNGDNCLFGELFRCMLLGEEHDLRNRTMHVEWNKVQNRNEVQSANKAVQSAEMAVILPSKCKFCTLEEIALLRIVQGNPSVTQKELAVQMSKSERTIKTITVHLQEIGILRRANGKRNGYWEIIGEGQ